MRISEFCLSNEAELTLALADFIEAELTQAVVTRGNASLVLSGGSTPRPLFELLAQRQLPWHKISITLADERWVDTASDESNEAMIRAVLLQGYAAVAKFIPLKNDADTAVSGHAYCEKLLDHIPKPFDLIILGMGNDGHTASLFPEVAGPALDNKNPQLCMPIQPRDAPHERISLTAAALLNSRRIVLHIVGERKWQVYQEAVRQGTVDEMPVRVVLHQNTVPVDVYWSP